VHLSDDGLRVLGEPEHPQVVLLEHAVPVARVHLAPGGVLGEVVAGAERPPGPSQDEHPNLLVNRSVIERGHEPRHEIAVQRVERLGPVHRQSADGTDVLGEHHGLVVDRVAHAFPLPVSCGSRASY
jgi:hypothetical protein